MRTRSCGDMATTDALGGGWEGDLGEEMVVIPIAVYMQKMLERPKGFIVILAEEGHAPGRGKGIAGAPLPHAERHADQDLEERDQEAEVDRGTIVDNTQEMLDITTRITLENKCARIASDLRRYQDKDVGKVQDVPVAKKRQALTFPMLEVPQLTTVTVENAGEISRVQTVKQAAVPQVATVKNVSEVPHAQSAEKYNEVPQLDKVRDVPVTRQKQETVARKKHPDVSSLVRPNAVPQIATVEKLNEVSHVHAAEAQFAGTPNDSACSSASEEWEGSECSDSQESEEWEDEIDEMVRTDIQEIGGGGWSFRPRWRRSDRKQR